MASQARSSSQERPTRLCGDQQARELLAPVYGWFTEGFEGVAGCRSPGVVRARTVMAGYAFTGLDMASACKLRRATGGR